MIPITLSRFFNRPFCVRYSGNSSSISKNLLKVFSHCSISEEDSKRINVLTFFSAISLLQATVFPNAVAAFKIPLSYFDNLFIAIS